MRIFYPGIHQSGSLEDSFGRAFESLDCEVDRLETGEPPELSKLRAVPGVYRVARRALRSFTARRLEARLLERASRGADILLIHKTRMIRPEILAEAARRAGALLFCFFPDHPFFAGPSGNRNTLGVIRHCDAYFAWGEYFMQQLRDAGARRVEFLPFAYDPLLHPSCPELAENPSGPELLFIGMYSAERARFFETILDRDFEIWGYGWTKAIRKDPRFARVVRNAPVVGPAMARAYASAKIGLNVIQVYPDGHNMRTYESLASGGFVMSSATRELVRLFRDGEELVSFRTPEELAEKAAHYLAHPEERLRIARNGRVRIAGETYESRARTMLEVAESLRRR